MRPLLLVLALFGAACSDPAGPCDPTSPATGIPAFDLVGALRAAGAEVVELGFRFDTTVLNAQTEALSVDGHEVLKWEYCTSGLMARDLGLFGVGVYAVDPPVVVLDAGSHLYATAQVLAEYDGDDAGLLALMTEVMGGEIQLPGRE